MFATAVQKKSAKHLASPTNITSGYRSISIITHGQSQSQMN